MKLSHAFVRLHATQQQPKHGHQGRPSCFFLPGMLSQKRTMQKVSKSGILTAKAGSGSPRLHRPFGVFGCQKQSVKSKATTNSTGLKAPCWKGHGLLQLISMGEWLCVELEHVGLEQNPSKINLITTVQGTAPLYIDVGGEIFD